MCEASFYTESEGPGMVLGADTIVELKRVLDKQMDMQDIGDMDHVQARG